MQAMGLALQKEPVFSRNRIRADGTVRRICPSAIGGLRRSIVFSFCSQELLGATGILMANEVPFFHQHTSQSTSALAFRRASVGQSESIQFGGTLTTNGVRHRRHLFLLRSLLFPLQRRRVVWPAAYCGYVRGGVCNQFWQQRDPTVLRSRGVH